MSSYVIGLTGGIACGKSNLSRALREAGACVIDADEISRALTEKDGAALPALREAFGDGIFSGDELDRRALALMVFGNEKNMERLNGILHPMIFAEMDARLDACEGIAVLEVPLLYECGLEKKCDEVWCAYVPQKEQVRRLCKRAGIGTKEALQRVHSQMSPLKKAHLADRVIRTGGTKEESARQVLELYREVILKRTAPGEK
ncbi:MAG: dephospho-CoA kinase [Clostridiales bacterium]|nr:dephospho-CoA kinase [Clostridiales bacterium]